MRVFLCVSLVITKVSAGPNLFSASIIASQVCPQLRKSRPRLHWSHITLCSFDSGTSTPFVTCVQLRINCHLLQQTMQSYCICMKKQPQCLPSPLYCFSCGRFRSPGLYILHMLSDSRPPAAKHLLLCERCEFADMLMLLFPSRRAV